MQSNQTLFVDKDCLVNTIVMKVVMKSVMKYFFDYFQKKFLIANHIKVGNKSALAHTVAFYDELKYKMRCRL